MSSNRVMSGHALNSQTMDISVGKEKENTPCISRVTPYLLSVLSIMVCLLAAAVCYFHLSTVQMETEMETMRKSLAQVRSRQGEKRESGLPGFTGNKGQRGRPGSLGMSGLDGGPKYLLYSPAVTVLQALPASWYDCHCLNTSGNWEVEAFC